MGTWSAPQTREAANQLAEILSEKVPVKLAPGIFYHLVGDDTLFDMFDDAAEVDPESDARGLVIYKLFDWNVLLPEHAMKYPNEDGAHKMISDIIDEHLPNIGADDMLLKISKMTNEEQVKEAITFSCDFSNEQLETMIISPSPLPGSSMVELSTGQKFHVDGVWGMVTPLTEDIIERYEARLPSEMPRPI